jgi:uncharacterized cupin superfamily protein
MAETETKKPIINIADAPLRDFGNGKQFVAKVGRVGQTLGLKGLGCAVHVVPPGKKAYPFHRHHVMDELFYIVSGSGQYRHGDDTLSVRAGDIIGAPAGQKAHQLINTGSEDLRYLGISGNGTENSVDVVDYPDSKKVGVAAGVRNADFKSATFAAMGRVTPADYFDGEDK